MVYSIRLEKDNNFSGYLSVKGRVEWKTKSIAVKHAEEFQEKNPEFSYIIEED